MNNNNNLLNLKNYPMNMKNRQKNNYKLNILNNPLNCANHIFKNKNTFANHNKMSLFLLNYVKLRVKLFNITVKK